MHIDEFIAFQRRAPVVGLSYNVMRVSVVSCFRCGASVLCQRLAPKGRYQVLYQLAQALAKRVRA